MKPDSPCALRQSFRRDLLSLPFVAETAEGRLDLWCVNPSRNDKADRHAGRTYGALWLHFLAKHEAGFMVQHLQDAWAARGPDLCEVRRGFLDEVSAALMATPLDHPRLLLARGYRVPDCPEDARAGLPTAGVREDGSLDLWAVEPTGEWGEDNAAGAFYAARAMVAALWLNDPRIICEISTAMFQRREMRALLGRDPLDDLGILVGWNTALAEMAYSVAQVTAYGVAMTPVYDDLVAA